MKKMKLRKNLVLIIILSLFIIGLEPSIGRNVESIHGLSGLKEPKKEYSYIVNDTFSDIIITNAWDNKISIHLGDGNGGFTFHKEYTVGEYPKDFVTGDFNKDGLLDLTIPTWNSAHNFVVLLGVGDGLFGDPKHYSTTHLGYGITSGDFNNDSRIDLAIISMDPQAVGTLDIFLGYGNGGFRPKWSLELEEKGVRRLTSGDFNSDGNLDLAFVHFNPGDFITVVFGDGTGKFYVNQTYQKGKGSNCVEITTDDFNVDGFLDLAVTNFHDDDISVYYNDGDGTFTDRQDYSTGWHSYPKNLIAEDFNIDGLPDLAVTLENKVCILLGNGTGGFENPVKYDVGISFHGNDLVAHDFNRDDFLDLVVTNPTDDTVTILLGYGNGTFGDRQDFPAGNDPCGIVTGNFNPVLAPDLNCDGCLNWSEVEPGSTVKGSFTVENIGDPKTLLDWEIESFPEWGTWTFVPSNGSDLTPEDGAITVDVSVVAPEEQNQQFSGTVKIVNIENTSDFCTVDVSLSTLFIPEFNVRGGFGVNVVIKNTGSIDVTDVKWEIHVEGGILGFIDKTANGTVDIKAGESQKVYSGMLFGLGEIDVKVTVLNEEKIATGTQIIILTIIKQ